MENLKKENSVTEHSKKADAESKDGILESLDINDLDKIPNSISGVMQSLQVSGIMPRINPLAEKIESEHITQLLTHVEESSKREIAQEKTKMKYQLVYAILGISFMVFCIIFLIDKEDLLKSLVLIGVSFLGGFGFGKTQNIKTTDYKEWTIEPFHKTDKCFKLGIGFFVI